MVSSGSGRDIRLHNKNRVLTCIYSAGRVTKQQIVEMLGMSLPTVLQNIKELLAEGLIRELGQMESTGGRKATVLAPVADVRLAVGIDVRKTYTQMLLIDLLGQVMASHRLPARYSNSPDFYAELTGAIEAFVAENNAAARLLGVGFSIPGIIKGDMITDSHILGIRDVPCHAFGGRLPWPSAYINDANAAGLAEMHQSGAFDTFVYLSLNDCVGGSIILGGRMYMGEHRRAGEFGHMRLVPSGRACYCGMEGCVDAFCAGQTLSEFAGGSLEGFFTRLDAGDPMAVVHWSRYLDSLAISVNNLHMAFDCPVVLGGIVGGYLNDFLDDMRLRAGEINTFGRDGSYVHGCMCRRDASALGGALLMLDDFFQLNRLM